MVIIVCVNIVVIRVIWVKYQIIKRWVGPTIVIWSFGYQVSLAVMVIMVNIRS